MSSGLAPTPELKRHITADITAFNTLRGQFAAAYNSNDAAAVAAYYADDAILMFPNQTAIEGRQGIQALLEAYFWENAAQIAHTPLETEVAGDWAYERGNIALTVAPKFGNPRQESIKYLAILKRQPDGSWKVYRDMENSNEPSPVAARK